MRLYNTLTRTEEAFTPGSDGTVRIYTCGLTVYARGHIGNFRTFVCVDVLRRTLRHLLGYRVKHVVNFTDVDDRTIAGAQKANMDLRSYTNQYIAAFHEDARALGLEDVEEMPRATDEENLKAMAGMIAALDRNGLTYRSDGSVYFRISAMPDYGRLARLDREGMKPGARVDSDTYAKEDARDFVLWKASKPDEPSWNLVDPPGRPGWHLECSAMSMDLLGETFDIHTGAVDLIFPHHENEIAQSEGALGRDFVNVWMHAAFLNISHEKMSKSLGNSYFTRDVLDRLDPAQGGEQLRFFLLRGHYRNEVDYTQEALADAGNTLRGFYSTLREVKPANDAIDWTHPLAARFRDAMNDDFDTPIAFAVLHELRGEVNRTRSAALGGLLRALGGTIGLLQQDAEAFLKGGLDLDVQALIDERNAAKKARNFPRADEIRKQLESKGIVLEDKSGGVTEWRKK
jgi:cysteinyl-tRNA synthetase